MAARPRCSPAALAALALASLLAAQAGAVRFYIDAGQRRCFTEELPSQTHITGDASVAAGKGEMEIDVWVTTLSGKVLYHRRAAEHGKFSFMTPAVPKHHELDDDDYDYNDNDPEEDTYKICIEHQQHASQTHPDGTRRLVSFRLHQSIGGEVRGSHDAASVSDTDRLQARMREMHTTLSGMIGDLSQLQRRERVLTKGMQSTTSRITMLAMFSLVVTLATSALQYRYYQGYFKQKKLC